MDEDERPFWLMFRTDIVGYETFALRVYATSPVEAEKQARNLVNDQLATFTAPGIRSTVEVPFIEEEE